MLARSKAAARLRSVAILGAVAVLVAPGAVRVAHACGGLWCSVDAPVNQAAERIVFVRHEDERISAVIEIQYRGPSSKFAWVIPIPGKPEIAISSTRALDRLDQFTEPRYELERIVEGTCKPGGELSEGEEVDAGAVADEDAGDDAPPGIRIVDQGTLGPYDYTTIEVDPSLDRPAQVAIDWFQANGYDLTGVDAEVLGPYLADGLNLLAFKLTKSAQKSAGSIRPVILTYEGTAPMIPIRPTAVAAEPDMGVLVWVVGAARAVPENYKSLILNEALIDWFNPRRTYRDVVTAAADQAGGQGFTTELAGPSAEAAAQILSEGEASRIDQLEREVWDDGVDALVEASFVFRDWEGFRDAVAASVELPSGLTLDEFAFDPTSHRGMVHVDTEKFFAELHARVIDPVADTQELIASRPYLTRLFTTMSAPEMTMDPVFTFNQELPPLDNRHVAKQYIECTPEVFEYEAPWRIVLPQGDTVVGEGTMWPVDATMVPASRAIQQLGNAGQGTVLVDNTKKIEEALDDLPRPGHEQEATPVRAPDAGACAVRTPGRSRSTWHGALLGLVVAAATRRRNARRI